MVVIELQHVEQIVGLQPVEGVDQTLAGLTHALALHRAGTVDDQQHLPGLALLADRSVGRGQHQQRVVVIAQGLGEYRRLVTGAGGQFPFEDEIAVHGYWVARQFDPVAAAIVGVTHAMTGAANAVQRHARIQIDVQLRLVRCLGIGQTSDNGTFDCPGRKSGQRVIIRLHSRGVARGHGQRQTQAEAVGVGDQQFAVLQRHGNAGTGIDIGHRGAEQVGPVLLHQGTALTAVAGLLVHGSGLLALADFALDAALADFQQHAMHGGILGYRQYIAALGKGPARVGEMLAHPYFGQWPADAYIHFGIEQQRRLPVVMGSAAHQEDPGQGLV